MKISNNLGNNILSDKHCKDQLTLKLRLTVLLQSGPGTAEDSIALLTYLRAREFNSTFDLLKQLESYTDIMQFQISSRKESKERVT